MDILKSSAEPYRIDIRQYGLRGGTNKAIMEFAIAIAKDDDEHDHEQEDLPRVLGPRMVAKAMESDDVLLIRQVSGTKYT